jgi:hypothetical protein
MAIKKELDIILLALYASLTAILSLSYRYLKNDNTSLNDLFQSLIIGTVTFKCPDKKELIIGTFKHKWTAPRNAVAPEKGLGSIDLAFPDPHGGNQYYKLGVGHGWFSNINEVLTGIGYILISLLAGDVVSQSETFRSSVLKVMLAELEKIGYTPILVKLYKSNAKENKITEDRVYDMQAIQDNLKFHYNHAEFISNQWDELDILKASFPAPKKENKVQGERKVREW